MLIARPKLIQRLQSSLEQNVVTALLGPRQCGKTTLALILKSNSRKKFTYFDLENPLDAARLENPLRVLENLQGIIVIDEIQRQPELFELLRVLSDRRPLRARFLILGSASFELIRRASESLAGRIGFVDMSGFSLAEAGTEKLKRLWFRGSFPKSFLAKNDAVSEIWRENFIRTFLEIYTCPILLSDEP